MSGPAHPPSGGRRAAQRKSARVPRFRTGTPGVPPRKRKRRPKPPDSSVRWCGREDSNFHGLPHSDLNAARLPVPPRPLESARPCSKSIWPTQAFATPDQPGVCRLAPRHVMLFERRSRRAGRAAGWRAPRSPMPGGPMAMRRRPAQQSCGRGSESAIRVRRSGNDGVLADGEVAGLELGARVELGELDLRRAPGAVGVVVERARLLVVDDAVVGIGRRGALMERRR